MSASFLQQTTEKRGRRTRTNFPHQLFLNSSLRPFLLLFPSSPVDQTPRFMYMNVSCCFDTPINFSMSPAVRYVDAFSASVFASRSLRFLHQRRSLSFWRRALPSATLHALSRARFFPTETQFALWKMTSVRLFSLSVRRLPISGTKQFYASMEALCYTPLTRRRLPL